MHVVIQIGSHTVKHILNVAIKYDKKEVNLMQGLTIS